jgi:P4 family phage/plasmid primase-like protien
MAALNRFLESNRIFDKDKDKVKPTVVNVIGGSYRVPLDQTPTFYQHYITALQEGMRLHLVERPDNTMDYGVVKVDFDFRYSGDNGLVRKYTKQNIKTMVALYQSFIRKYFAMSDDTEEELTCFVTERSAPYKKANEDKIRDGFHLFFNIGLPFAFQHVLRNMIVAEIRAKGLLDNVGTLNPIDDVVDKAVVETGGWFLYGSRKPNLDPYLLSMEIDHKGVERDFRRWNLLDLVTVLSLHKSPSMLPKKAYLTVALEQEICVRAPNAVPVKLQNTALVQKKKTDLERLLQQSAGFGGGLGGGLGGGVGSGLMKMSSLPENFEHIKSLVNVLSPDRCDSYRSWFEVGACLFNIDSRLLPLWVEFSKVSPKYKEGECSELWLKFKPETLGIASLNYWAKLDNPLEYEKIRRNSIRFSLEQSIRTPTHYDIARVVHIMYKHVFVCTSQKFKNWYKFNGNHWEISEMGMCVRTVLSNEVAAEYLRFANECNQKIMKNSADDTLTEDDDSVRKSLEDKVKSANKIASCLKTTSFKDNVLREASELFMDFHFMEQLDSNIMLTGTLNGVLDLKTLEFRQGRPDDYISKRCNVNYVAPDLTNPEYRAKLALVEMFFVQILPVPNVRQYLLTRLACCLEGRDDQKFPILTGIGGNGKTILLEFMQLIFGDYACTISATVFTQKSGSASSASPELARIRGVRLISAEETEEGSTFNVAKMKELTGGNKITPRKLFQDIEEFKPQAHWFLVCNNIPKITSDDGGTWRRISIVDFISIFVEDPGLPQYKGVPHVYQRDEHIGEKLAECGEVFLSHLLHTYYAAYQKQGRLTEPDEVKLRTMSFRQENDVFLQFIQERHIVKCANGSEKIKDIYNDFKVWFKDSGIEHPPPQRDLKSYFNKQFGEYDAKKGGWKIATMAGRDDSSPSAGASVA